MRRATIGACAVLASVCIDAARAAEPVSAPSTVRCEISGDREGPHVVIGAVITSDTDIAGTYRLRTIKGTGSTAVRSGEMARFAAARDRPARIGNVAVESPGEVDATLTVTWSGGRVQCTRHIAPQ